MDEKKQDNEQNNGSQQTPKPRTRRGRKKVDTKKSETATQKESVEEKESSNKEMTLQESIAYLHNVGIKKVSNKTFINEADLVAFLQEDFTNINKTRALGFIQILEREYPVKLDELKKSYLSFYQQGRKKEKQEFFVQPKIEKDTEWKKYLLWTMPVVVLAFLGWYFTTQEKSELSNLESEQEMVSSDINTDIVVEAEKNLTKYQDDQKKISASEESEEIINSARVSPLKRNNEEIDTATNSDEGVDQNSAAMPKNDDLDLDKMVKQMVMEYNLTLDANESVAEKNQTKTPETATQQVIVSNVPTTVKKESTKSAVKKVSKESRKKVTKKKNTKNKTKVSQEVINSKLYIVPHKKSWVGIIYLDDFSKKDFLIRKTLRLNSTRPQLIVVGQKEFEIFNNGYSYRFRGKGPVRFIYKDGDIMEITNREFRKYSKGTTW
jgi:hypothetical protein